MDILNKIDFLIIGAQKSATTSLFQYLSLHPMIYMPPEKEVNFFSDDRKFRKGISYYLDEYFGSAIPETLWGEASPNYMCYDYVPERIFNFFPDIKLISILRNPIDRAYSHYRMAVRKNTETRSFESCINQLINRGTVKDDKVEVEKEFVMFGEYGRLLSNYLKFFPKENIKIVFMETLKKQPADYMKNIFNFLGISEDFQSETFGKQYHVGGKKRFLLLEELLMTKWIKEPLRLLLPAQIRRKLGYWLITQFTVKPTNDSGPNSETRQALRDYYKDDVLLLEQCFGFKVPWDEFNKFRN